MALFGWGNIPSITLASGFRIPIIMGDRKKLAVVKTVSVVNVLNIKVNFGAGVIGYIAFVVFEITRFYDILRFHKRNA